VGLVYDDVVQGRSRREPVTWVELLRDPAERCSAAIHDRRDEVRLRFKPGKRTEGLCQLQYSRWNSASLEAAVEACQQAGLADARGISPARTTA
jgi:hypothetical protein